MPPVTTSIDLPRLNRVPQVTAEFWLIKLMAVTMRETAADYLAVDMGLGLTATSLIMTGILAVALFMQFARKRYVPWSYWLAVVLISIVGTLVTDNLVDNFDVSLMTTTIGFSLALAATFALWFAAEGTLSIHTIFTRPLGASFGDLLSQPGEYVGFGFGRILTSAIFLTAIALIVIWASATHRG